jgi:hypothetical protein
VCSQGGAIFLQGEEGGGPPTDISRPAASAPWCILASFHLPPLIPLALPSYSPPQTRRTRVGGSVFNISLFYFNAQTATSPLSIMCVRDEKFVGVKMVYHIPYSHLFPKFPLRKATLKVLHCCRLGIYI